MSTTTISEDELGAKDRTIKELEARVEWCEHRLVSDYAQIKAQESEIVYLKISIDNLKYKIAHLV